MSSCCLMFEPANTQKSSCPSIQVGHLVAPFHSSGERVEVSSETYVAGLEERGHRLEGSVPETWAALTPSVPGALHGA